MTGEIRTLVPSREIFIAWRDFWRWIFGQTAQLLKRLCAVSVPRLGPAVFFRQVLRTSL
jgi:hypothetical protein